MTTSTKELIDFLDSKALTASYFKDCTDMANFQIAAQRLRELESQVTELELKLLTERGAKAWADVPDATAFVEGLRGNSDKPDCVWTFDSEQGMYDTSCGEAWMFSEGLTLEENKVKFCPFCQGAVKEAT